MSQIPRDWYIDAGGNIAPRPTGHKEIEDALKSLPLHRPEDHSATTANARIAKLETDRAELVELLQRIDIAERDAITGEGAIAHLRVLADAARALLARLEADK